MATRRRVAPALVTRAASIPLRADGSLRIAAVSDTHSHPHPATLDRLRAFAPDAIVHGGDVGDLGVLDDLAMIAPVHAVRGNIDGLANDLPDVIHLDVGGLRMLLTHIAVYGPKLRPEVAKLARAAGASLVVCGHSHVPFIGDDRGLTVFNPGSVGPKRFQLPIVFGSILIAGGKLRLAHLSVETGERWLPPG